MARIATADFAVSVAPFSNWGGTVSVSGGRLNALPPTAYAVAGHYVPTVTEGTQYTIAATLIAPNDTAYQEVALVVFALPGYTELWRGTAAGSNGPTQAVTGGFTAPAGGVDIQILSSSTTIPGQMSAFTLDSVDAAPPAAGKRARRLGLM